MSPLCVQSQASSSELGKQLAEVESLLQKQDLLEAQISAHGETIATISSTALKVSVIIQPDTAVGRSFRRSSINLSFSSSQMKVRDGQQIQSRVRALDSQYKSLVSLSSSRLSSVSTSIATDW